MAENGYKTGQQNNWYMNLRMPSNTNYIPIDISTANEFDIKTDDWRHLAIVGDILYKTKFIDRNTYIYAVDKATDEYRSSYILGGRVLFAAFDNGLYYTSGNYIYASKYMGKYYSELWNTYIENAEISKLTYDDRHVYVVYYTPQEMSEGSTSTLRALEAETGQTVWEYKIDARFGVDRIAVGDNKIFISFMNYTSVEDQVIALDAVNGSELWKKGYNLNDIFEPNINLVYMDQVLYISVLKTSGNEITALNTATGEVLWVHRPDLGLNNIWGENICVAKNLVVYTSYYKLEALDRRTGIVKWSVDLRTIKPELTSLYLGNFVLTDSTVFIAVHNLLAAFDSNTGKFIKLWTVETMNLNYIQLINLDEIAVNTSDGKTTYIFKPKESLTLEYIVKPGDTLYKIAAMFNTGAPYLASLNGLANPDYLMVGQKLLVPNFTKQNYIAHTVKSGDTLYKLAQIYASSIQKIAEMNNLSDINQISPGQVLKIPQVVFYIVQVNDTLWKISQKYHVELSDLIKNNNLQAPYTIYAGQKLMIK